MRCLTTELFSPWSLARSAKAKPAQARIIIDPQHTRDDDTQAWSETILTITKRIAYQGES